AQVRWPGNSSQSLLPAKRFFRRRLAPFQAPTKKSKSWTSPVGAAGSAVAAGAATLAPEERLTVAAPASAWMSSCRRSIATYGFMRARPVTNEETHRARRVRRPEGPFTRLTLSHPEDKVCARPRARTHAPFVAAGRLARLVALEVLHRALVLFCRRTRAEGAEVAALAGAWIDLARVQAVLAGG